MLKGKYNNNIYVATTDQYSTTLNLHQKRTLITSLQYTLAAIYIYTSLQYVSKHLLHTWYPEGFVQDGLCELERVVDVVDLHTFRRSQYLLYSG